MKKIQVSKILPTWIAVLVTAAAPFGPAIYDAFQVGEVQYIYSYEYNKNPLLEWNRQMGTALTRLDDLIKNTEGLSKSILQSLTKELLDNAPALAAHGNFKPFDSIEVKISNVSSLDLKNIKVIFHGCSGYDSHKTWPDTTASLVSPEIVRKQPEPTTISYYKLSRKIQGQYHNAYITYFGSDAYRCEPEVFADLDSGISAVGVKGNIDEYVAEKQDNRRWWSDIFDYTFKLGIIFIMLAIYFRLNDRISRIQSARIEDRPENRE